MANAEMAMEPSRAVKEYKDENIKLQTQLDEYAKALGKVTVERDWLEKKLNSLDSLNKKELVESGLKKISITRQCELLDIARSSLYYTPIINNTELATLILFQIALIFGRSFLRNTIYKVIHLIPKCFV